MTLTSNAVSRLKKTLLFIVQSKWSDTNLIDLIAQENLFIYFSLKATEENVDFGVNIFYFFLHKTAQLSRFFAGFTYCTEFIYSWKWLDLLQAKSTSWVSLASGASFLGCEFVPRHIKSDEGLFWKSNWQDCNIFSTRLTFGVTMAIIKFEIYHLFQQ